MFVELDNTIEGLIRFSDMTDDHYIYNEDNKTLVGQNTEKIFKIGDKVNIKVIAASKFLKTIDFKLLK